MVAIDCGYPDPETGLSCCWNVDTSTCCPPDEDVTPEHEAVVAKAAARASTILMRLSGYTIGQCATTIRPLHMCGECRTTCCGGADGIRIYGPNQLWVNAVTEVRVGSEIIPDTEWRFDKEDQALYRTPPTRWPRKDAKWVDCGEEGSFCVDVVVGSAPDAWALDVASNLTCELVNACSGGKCRLPRNATQVNAQGITITLSDDELMGLLPEVAGWVKAVNPHKARMPARVYSPDLDNLGWR